jgi:DNA polymerase-3 subunit delta'
MFFPEIIGQPKAVKLLSRALERNRLAHGYLFIGPDGVGKKTTARALASVIFCTSGDHTRNSPCGHCSGCLKFVSGNHPDFLVLSPQGAAVKIDQVRKLKKELSFSPFEARLRVVLIEDVQTMRREAGNSLLKILEEPPPDNLLLLVASESEPVLPTIVSRCQVIPFVPLAHEDTCRILRTLYPERDSEEIEILARLTGGCPGQAHVAAGQGDLLALHRECVDALLQPDPDESYAVEQALALAARMGALTEGLETLFDMLALFFKETMTAKLTAPAGRGEAGQAAARERWNLQQLSDMVHAIDYARRCLARNSNRFLVCEVLMLELFNRSDNR